MIDITNSQISDEQILQSLQEKEKRLRFLLPAFVARLKYRLWLASLRETSILIQLIPHYSEIPPRTPSKLIVGVFVKFSKMKKLLFAVEKRLRRRIY